jgi:tetratricopeptide (TPR) repeat protein/transcriptional regulator with XRE-family HTH domain
MFGPQVRAHRQRLGMSQEELATRTGMSVRSIHRLEVGHTERPRAGTVRLLADAFELAGAERDRFCQSALEPADAAAHDRPVPAQLPADVVGFAGRSDQLGRLTKLIDDGDGPATVVISAIAGTAGVGKTALALHWAHQVLDRFPDGQLYVNLRGFDAVGAVATPGEVLRAFLDALNVPAHRVPASLDAQAALYRTLLAERRMLLLLDNARDVEQVRPLLPGAPGCLVLVTSRSQLTGLIAGAGAVPLPLDLLSPDEARDLLARRVGVDRIATEPDAVDTIIERCARLPLALAIAGARAAIQPERPLAALATEMKHPHDRLDTLATGDAGTDVRSVFSWSYQQLTEPAARLFRLLGVHPGPDLDVSAAASLAGIAPARGRPLLAELVRAHLVCDRVPGRYTLHDLLRAYAGEQAASGEPEDERQAAVRRLLDHYVGCALKANAALDPARDVIELITPPAGVTVDDFESVGAAVDWFTAEYQVLIAAVRLAAHAGLDRHAWQLVFAMGPYGRRGLRDAVALHHIALQAARHLGDPVAQGYSHRMLGQIYTLLAEHDEARAHYEHAFEVYGDDDNQAHVQLGLAEILERQGRYRDALHQAEQALARFQTTGHGVGQADALNELGSCHARLGDHETALEYCQQALGLHQELGYRRGEAAAWHSLGVAYHHLGRYAVAVAAYQQALTLFRDQGNRYNEADTLAHLGETYRASGDIDAARGRWRAALAIFADLDHPDAEQVRVRLRDTP